MIAKFIRQAIKGEECEIYGDGTQTRDFIFIYNLIETILKAAGFDHGGEIFQIATSKERTVNEIAQIIQKQLKNHGIEMRIGYGNARIGDVKRNYSDISKATKILGWRANTSIDNGIKKTIEYFIKIKNGKN